jgi:predicted nucleotidyltransferase
MSALPDILDALRTHRADLSRLGVTRAVVFGSVARGGERPDSDIDIAIAVDPARVATLFAHGDIQQHLEAWLGKPVDLARLDRLRPEVAADVLADGVDAF